ncbi:hypothetical protein PHLCEN_2v980 [Hermanssonia centrifuga]|uniref:Ribonuclease H1 N-terminal domain-containing protein n=1 Tax=Hermanssonia centrifuga TaxID=98765 RepID=A0A2R6S495_9APHY|nr:hypothetical protein PHLCEN_2v980 [Hermanssonia centrifuga]
MPKAKKTKYYAVRRGFGGPRVYDTWEEVKRAQFNSTGCLKVAHNHTYRFRQRQQ